jgi:hypothetical protein
MFTLESKQLIVEKLYYESRDLGDEEGIEQILNDRIRKHLRLVLCDLIILQKLNGDFPLLVEGKKCHSGVGVCTAR